METIPVQLDQLLTLALGVVFVTQALKAAAKELDAHVGGKGAVVVSAAVSVALTALAYWAGWVPVTLPSCGASAPLACAQGWLATAGAALALANLLYAGVYGRVFAAPAASR